MVAKHWLSSVYCWTDALRLEEINLGIDVARLNCYPSARVRGHNIESKQTVRLPNLNERFRVRAPSHRYKQIRRRPARIPTGIVDEMRLVKISGRLCQIRPVAACLLTDQIHRSAEAEKSSGALRRE